MSCLLQLMQISKEEFDAQAKKCLGNDNRKCTAIFLKLLFPAPLLQERARGGCISRLC